MEDENTLQDVDAAYDDTEDTTNEVVEQDESSNVEPKKEKKKKEKKPKGEKPPKKPLSKSSKTLIIIVSVVLAIAILATAIAVPISIANRGKIFVSSKEDFSRTDGTHFVLNDDLVIEGNIALGNINNIDLNGKTLRITGELKIESTSEDSVLLGFDNSTGILEAGTINIMTPSEVKFNSVTKANGININAKSVVINNEINLVDNSNITAHEVTINSAISFADAEKENILSINNANTVNANAQLNANISIINNVDMETPASININGDVNGNILANQRSVVSINSTVSGRVDTNDTTLSDDILVVNSKINKVIIGNKAFVKEVHNVSTVLVDEEAIYPNMTGVDKVDFVRQLERVAYIRVDEVGDKVFLSFTSVIGADAYIITINDNEPMSITDTYLDITAYVKNAESGAMSATTHKISVQAVSSASPETLKPSKLSIYEYTTFMTLSPATNIMVEYLDDITITLPNGMVRQYNNVPMLSFDKVDFADEYIISINGKIVKSKSNSLNIMEYISNVTQIDVTDENGNTYKAPVYTPIGGSFVIQVVATSKNENIKNSKPSVYKHEVIIPLESNEADKTIHLNAKNEDEFSISLSWSKVNNAKYYEVIMINEDDSEQVIYRTTSNTFTTKSGDMFDGNQVKTGKRFMIRAVSNSPYYTPITSNIQEFIR